MQNVYIKNQHHWVCHFDDRVSDRVTETIREQGSVLFTSCVVTNEERVWDLWDGVYKARKPSGS
jgi:hypothetical protein